MPKWFEMVGSSLPVIGDYISQQNANQTAQQATNQQLAGIAQGRSDILANRDQAINTLSPLISQGMGQYGNLLPFAAASMNQQNQAITGANQQQEQLGAGISALKNQQGNLDVNQFLDPSMQFTMNQGLNALNASAAARGGLLSGGALKNALEYSQGLASQNYNNAVNQALANRNQQVGIGQNLAQIGSQGIDTNRAIAGTGAQISSGLYDTGANALTNKANIYQTSGSDLANLSMNAGNTAAAGTAAQQSPEQKAGKGLGGLLQAGAGAILGGGSSILGAVGGLFSDEDLKDHINDVSDEDIDEFLSKMTPKEFDYTQQGLQKGAQPGRHTGVMAQDVEKSKIGKTLVKKDQEGYRQVDVPQAVGALLAANANMNKRLKKVESKKGGK